MADIDANVTKLFDFAEKALTDARSASNRISSFSPAISGGNLDYTVRQGNMPLPTAIGDLLSPDNSSSTIQFLNSESEKWLDKYFPEINSCGRSTADEWACGILTGQQPFGLSREVFEAVWHESRDREYRGRNTAVRQLHSEFSARGFTLPQGALIGAITRAEEQAADAIGAVNRAQTVKDADIKLELVKYAADIAVRLKLGMLQAMADFYRQWIELPNKDLEASRIRTQAYSAFQDSLSSYWRVQLGFEELRLNAAKLRMDGKIDESRIRVAAADGSRNGALGQATNAFADIAAAAAGAASTLNANVTQV